MDNAEPKNSEIPELRAPYPSWDAFSIAYDKVRTRGGTVVDHGVLEKWGISKPSARKVLPALKFLGIIDQNGNPQPLWAELAVKDEQRYQKAVGDMLRNAYRKLLAAYQDAFSESDDRLSDAIGDVYDTSASTRPAAVNFLRRMLAAAGLASLPAAPQNGQAKSVAPRTTQAPAQRTTRAAAQPQTAQERRDGGHVLNVHVHVNVSPGVSEDELVDFFRKVNGAKKRAMEGDG